eukprot:scaffold77992_cov66-Phaeocystis_antarctica.AAC.3
MKPKKQPAIGRVDVSGRRRGPLGARATAGRATRQEATRCRWTSRLHSFPMHSATAAPVIAASSLASSCASGFLSQLTNLSLTSSDASILCTSETAFCTSGTANDCKLLPWSRSLRRCPPVRLISTASSWSTAARSPPVSPGPACFLPNKFKATGDSVRTGRLQPVEMLSDPGATNPADAMAMRVVTDIARWGYGNDFRASFDETV